MFRADLLCWYDDNICTLRHRKCEYYSLEITYHCPSISPSWRPANPCSLEAPSHPILICWIKRGGVKIIISTKESFLSIVQRTAFVSSVVSLIMGGHPNGAQQNLGLARSMLWENLNRPSCIISYLNVKLKKTSEGFSGHKWFAACSRQGLRFSKNEQWA